MSGEVPFHLMDRVKARLVAALDREFHNYSESPDQYGKLLESLLLLRVSYSWYAISDSDDVQRIWNTLSETPALLKVILLSVADVKEEIYYDTVINSEGTVINPSRATRWKSFCETMAEANVVNKTMDDYRVDVGELTKLLDNNPWLVIVLILSRTHPETIGEKLKLSGGR